MSPIDHLLPGMNVSIRIYILHSIEHNFRPR